MATVQPHPAPRRADMTKASEHVAARPTPTRIGSVCIGLSLTHPCATKTPWGVGGTVSPKGLTRLTRDHQACPVAVDGLAIDAAELRPPRVSNSVSSRRRVKLRFVAQMPLRQCFVRTRRVCSACPNLYRSVNNLIARHCSGAPSGLAPALDTRYRSVPRTGRQSAERANAAA